MADSIRARFDEYRTLGMERIQKCLDDKEEEGQYLELKELSNPQGKVDDKVKQTLAKEVSGLANGGGGLLIWGIREKDHAADEGIPIPNLRQFRRRLEEVTSQVIVPPLDGVEHLAIEEASGSDRGYVVTYIPDGKFKPHRSMAKDQHVYFLRSLASTETMADAAVRAFVTSGARPSLTLTHTLHGGQWERLQLSNPVTHQAEFKYEWNVRVHLQLQNDGGTIAENCAVMVQSHDSIKNAGQAMGIRLVEAGEFVHGVIYRNAFIDLMYPGTEQFAGEMILRFKDFQGERNRVPFLADGVVLSYRLYARNFTGSGELRFSAEQLSPTTVAHW